MTGHATDPLVSRHAWTDSASEAHHGSLCQKAAAEVDVVEQLRNPHGKKDDGKKEDAGAGTAAKRKDVHKALGRQTESAAWWNVKARIGDGETERGREGERGRERQREGRRGREIASIISLWSMMQQTDFELTTHL